MNTNTTLLSHKLRIATSTGIYFFQTSDIIRLEAKSNYTFIFLTNGSRVFTARVLKQFAMDLVPFGFLRVHRTHLINPEHIAQLRPNGTIVMTDDSVAEVSRRHQPGVRRLGKVKSEK